ncbi:hypothetical protein U9M48_008223, partial [Paspalum notatum var. saurae]
SSTAEFKFTVCRRSAVIVIPAAPTPRELKRLSDIDDQELLRLLFPVMIIFKRNKSPMLKNDDPAPVIRDAISRALGPEAPAPLLVLNPLAGRLRELEGRKLAVDCTGEGVVFIEADANVHLKALGGNTDILMPPFPCLNELIFVPAERAGSSAILNSPLLRFQLTRLACRGFILAMLCNHTIADAVGLLQFLGAVAELSRGASAPTLTPVWQRELLKANNTPSPRFAHREYGEEMAAATEDAAMDMVPTDVDDMVLRSFLFGRREIAMLRDHLPPDLRSSASTFDLLSGFLWKCRTAALDPEANQEMRFICTVDLRGSKNKARATASAIPTGYYGNAMATPAAISMAGQLCTDPLSYAVELVRKAKANVDMEYLQSVADLMVQRGRPPLMLLGTYVLSDLTMVSRADLHFGWGSPVYTGPAEVGGSIPWMFSFLTGYRDSKGEKGIGVPICLPRLAMDKFVKEMGKIRADLDFGWGSPVYTGPAEVGRSIPWMFSFLTGYRDSNGEKGIGVPICLPRLAMDKFVKEMGKMFLMSPHMVVPAAEKQPNAKNKNQGKKLNTFAPRDALHRVHKYGID